MKKLLILSILVLGLASCGEKKVDITPKDEKIKIVWSVPCQVLNLIINIFLLDK